MSVVIKGMAMPETCSYCEFRESFIDCNYCHLVEMDMEFEESNNCRHSNCPLVELPEKHGRLIDADAYVSMMEGKCDYEKALDPYVLSVCRGGIKLMPTIVEAEGEEEEG